MEYERLDFKESASYLKDIIPAMAMTLGGIVICGISDARQIVGCPLGQKTLDKIARAGHETGVDVQAHALAVDGRELTIVAVPEVRDRIVTTTDGRLLRRVGSDNQPREATRSPALFVRVRSDPARTSPPASRLHGPRS